MLKNFDLESFHIKISNPAEHQFCEPRQHWQNIYYSTTLSLLENPRLQSEAGYIKLTGRKKKRLLRVHFQITFDPI